MGFLSGAYSEPSQMSRMEHFAKLVNGIKPLSVFLQMALPGMLSQVLITLLV